MPWELLFIIGGAVAFTVAQEIAERIRVRKLLDRPCASIRWHRRFPDVSHEEIRAFLKLFTKAFAFDEIHSSKFSPDDRPLAIYNARYIPHLTLDDNFEFESLMKALEESYGINLETVWHDDLTLGKLFALTRDPSLA